MPKSVSVHPYIYRGWDRKAASRPVYGDNHAAVRLHTEEFEKPFREGCSRGEWDRKVFGSRGYDAELLGRAPTLGFARRMAEADASEAEIHENAREKALCGGPEPMTIVGRWKEIVKLRRAAGGERRDEAGT